MLQVTLQDRSNNQHSIHRFAIERFVLQRYQCSQQHDFYQRFAIPIRTDTTNGDSSAFDRQ